VAWRLELGRRLSPPTHLTWLLIRGDRTVVNPMTSSRIVSPTGLAVTHRPSRINGIASMRPARQMVATAAMLAACFRRFRSRAVCHRLPPLAPSLSLAVPNRALIGPLQRGRVENLRACDSAVDHDLLIVRSAVAGVSGERAAYASASRSRKVCAVWIGRSSASSRRCWSPETRTARSFSASASR